MRFRIAMGLLVAVLISANALAQDASKKEGLPQGTWKLTGGEADGKAFSDAEIKGGKLVLKGDHYSVFLAGKETIEGTQKLDSSKKPKTIDIVDGNGSNKGKTCLGIWELKGDQFRVAFSQPGKPRPAKFSTAPESGQWIHIWTRVKE